MSRFLVILLCLAALSGCASQFPPFDPAREGASAEFDIPPKDLLAKVKEIVSSDPLSLGVTEENKGTIVTGYKRYAGDFRVARRWQEQTRFRITVIPDFDEPTKRSRLQIYEQTEQRAAEGMKWESAAELDRPERGKELLEQIRQQLR